MKKTVLILAVAVCAGASVANATFVLVDNGDFSAGGGSWALNGSGGTNISFEPTGGNSGGYGQIDNTAGAWGGVLVAEGPGTGIPLGDLGLVAGDTYDFSLDMILLGGVDPGTVAGIKLESWNGGLISDSGDINFAIDGNWTTYTASYTIEPTATAIKFVPLVAGPAPDSNISVGFDNVGVEVVPEPSSALLVALGAFGLLGLRRRQ